MKMKCVNKIVPIILILIGLQSCSKKSDCQDQESRYSYPDSSTETPIVEFVIDTTGIRAEEFKIIPSELFIMSFEEFAVSTSKASSKANQEYLIQLANVIKTLFSVEERSFWVEINKDTVIARIERKEADLAVKLNALLIAFSNNPTLSSYIPLTSEPAMARRMNTARINNAFFTEENLGILWTQEVYGDAEDSLACIAAWDNWQDSVLVVYQSIFLNDSVLLDQAFSAEKLRLDNLKSELVETIQAAYSSRKDAFIEQTSVAENQLLTAQQNGKISEEVLLNLRLFNIIVTSLNIEKAHELFSKENELIESGYSDSKSKLINVTEAFKKMLFDKYYGVLAEIKKIVTENRGINCPSMEESNSGVDVNVDCD